jgi:hypothetical protein
MAFAKERLMPMELIESRSHIIRWQNESFDTDLAEIYGAPTKTFNQAGKRNSERFPADSRYQLTAEKQQRWSQIVTTSPN